MKIALLIPSFAGGGAERVQLTLAREFQRLGHRVQFVVFTQEGPLRGDLPDGVELIDLGARRGFHAVLPFGRYLKTQMPDAVIASMAHVGIVAALGQLVSRWKGKLLVRLDAPLKYHLRHLSFFRRKGLRFFQQILFPRVHIVVAVSEEIAKEYREEFSLENCRVIHNPVFPLRPGGRTSGLPHLFFQSKEPVILAVGRLSREKGFHFLIQSFAALRNQRKAKLIILGEGELRPQLEKMIQDLSLSEHVAMPGFVKDPLAYYSHSTVFALSSESEPFGLSLVEALYVGIPVVSTFSEGPRDIITDKDIGEMVPFGEAGKFAEALLRSFSSPETHRDLRKRRAMDFHPDRIVGEYLLALDLRPG